MQLLAGDTASVVLVLFFAVRWVLATWLERKWPVYTVAFRSVVVADLVTTLFLAFVTTPAAEYVSDRLPNPGWRVVGLVADWPLTARLVAYILVADFGHYWVHRILHTPALWRFHRWHHAPEHMSWLAGNRESFVDRLLVSLPYIWAWPLLAASPWWLAPVLLNFAALKNDWMHLNVTWRLRTLERILVTPRYHHIHHSDNPAHYTKNLGALFSFWDRMFGTYEDPDRAPGRLTFGIGEKVSFLRLFTGL